MRTRTLAALAVLAIVAVAAPAPAQDTPADIATQKISARGAEIAATIEIHKANINVWTDQRAQLQLKIVAAREQILVLSGAVTAFGESIKAINDVPTTLTATVAEIVATPTPTPTPTPVEK